MDWYSIKEGLPDLHGVKGTSDEYKCLVVTDENRVREESRMVVIGTKGKGIKWWAPMPKPPVDTSNSDLSPTKR